jgi:lipoprotein-anchoring transpeptidase ErfK/SrfK
MTNPRKRRNWRLVAAALAATGLVLSSAACSGDAAPAWQGGTPGASAPPAAAQGPQVAATITEPAADAKDAEPLAKVAFTTSNADKATVEVKDKDGKTVEGTTAEDGSSWTPAKALAWGATYTATVTATGADGKTGSATSTFTVKKQPAKVIRASSFLGDGQTVGVGMPMIVKFDRAIPQNARADVERRLDLRSEPKQEGTWAWYTAQEVHYRPKEFWQSGTKIKYSVNLAGVPIGDGYYGRNDLSVELKVGRSLVMTVDDKTKQMTVVKDGKELKKIPVSLGKASTPSSSGTMVVMEKQRKTVFDTMDDPDPANRYRTPIDFAQRLTYGGEFIHAAPWSESKQGRVNVSHGCVNVSEKEGGWLFGQTIMGDPITVKNTSRKLKWGNGWTDWSKSWDDYRKDSALA